MTLRRLLALVLVLALPGGAAAQVVQSGGAQPLTVLDTNGNLVRPGDAANNAVRVNIVAGAGSGGTAQADETGFTEGGTAFTPIGGVYNETIASDPTEDQAAAVRLTAKRAIHVNLRDASGNEVAVGGGTQYDEDTPTQAGEKVTMAGVVRQDTPASLVGANNDRTVLSVDSSGRLWVNPGTVTVTDGSGALTVDGTVAVSGTVTVGDGSGPLTVDGTVNVGNFPTTATTSAISVRCVTPAGDAFESCAGTGGGGSFDGIIRDGSGAGQADVIGSAPGGSEQGLVVRNIPSGTQTVTGTVTVQDGGGSITVDGTVGVSGTVTVDQADTASADYDTGAGTVNQTMVGLALPGAGGPVAGGTATNPVRVDPTGTTPQPVSGTVSVGNFPTSASTSAIAVRCVNTAGDAFEACGGGGGGGGTSSNFGSAFPSAGTAAGFSDGTNMQGARVYDVHSGGSAEYALGVNLRFSGGSGSVEAGTASAPLRVDPTGTTTQPVSGTVTANQGGSWTVTANAGSGTFGTNLAQVGGSATNTGVGTASTGTVRVAVARDSEICNPIDTAQVAVSVSASGNTELVPLTSFQTIYVCDVLLVAGGTVDVQLVYGTGTACAIGETDLTGAVPLVANTGYVHNFNGRLKTASSTALCIELSAAVSVQGTVTYRKL